MKTPIEHHERWLDAKSKRRARKRKPRMAVSGKSVFTLRSIIKRKATKAH